MLPNDHFRTNIPVGGGRLVFMELPLTMTEEEWGRLMCWIDLIRKGTAEPQTSDDERSAGAQTRED